MSHEHDLIKNNHTRDSSCKLEYPVITILYISGANGFLEEANVCIKLKRVLTDWMNINSFSDAREFFKKLMKFVGRPRSFC